MQEKNNDLKNVVVRNVSETTKQQLTNIAKNKGTTVTGLLRPEINRIVREAPEQMKRPPLMD